MRMRKNIRASNVFRMRIIIIIKTRTERGGGEAGRPGTKPDKRASIQSIWGVAVILSHASIYIHVHVRVLN